MSRSLIHRAEKEIAVEAIKALLKHGCRLTVFNGEDDEITMSTDPDAILGAMMTTDEDYLIVHHPVGDERIGWVRFVYGNDGWDVINDYTTNLETVLTPVNALADEMSR